MPAPTQLALSLPLAPHYGRDAFVTGPSNVVAARMVDSWPDWPARVMVLSGPPGSGKTHLVHAWAERSGADIFAAEALRGGGQLDAARATLALEDFDPADVPEPELFHLVNSVLERQGSLLLTAREPVEAWRVALPDLQSRLRLAAPARLGPPDDDLLRRVLVKLFADRQLLVDKPLLDYLLVRMERSLSATVALVDALDREALAEGRRITRAVAAQVLAGEGDVAAGLADVAEDFADPK
jgi:chromosomal replication initiation ATPase DnaA